MTTDDEQHAARLESWYASHPGTCLLCAQKRLLARGLAPWPHEGRTLLEVNCGPGLVEPHLRAMGLDVTGCEPSPALRNRFSSRLGYTYIVDPAHADLLPYGDASFDWVLLRLEHTKCGTDLAAVLGEARRVALKGVAVLVWNRWSLPALCDVRHTINASPQSAVRVFRELVSWRFPRACVLARGKCTGVRGSFLAHAPVVPFSGKARLPGKRSRSRGPFPAAFRLSFGPRAPGAFWGP